MLTVFLIASICCFVSLPIACPGSAALYRSSTKTVNSCPLGTPWKARPVLVPSGLHTVTSGALSGDVFQSATETVSLLDNFAKVELNRSGSAETERSSRYSFSSRGGAFRARAYRIQLLAHPGGEQFIGHVYFLGSNTGSCLAMLCVGHIGAQAALLLYGFHMLFQPRCGKGTVTGSCDHLPQRLDTHIARRVYTIDTGFL